MSLKQQKSKRGSGRVLQHPEITVNLARKAFSGKGAIYIGNHHHGTSFDVHAENKLQYQKGGSILALAETKWANTDQLCISAVQNKEPTVHGEALEHWRVCVRVRVCLGKDSLRLRHRNCRTFRVVESIHGVDLHDHVQTVQENEQHE